MKDVMKMGLSICLYSSSSEKLDAKYYEVAEKIGMKIAQRGDTLVFGAGTVGTMGAAARGAKKLGGRIVGVIPEALNCKGIVYEECDELYVTPEMRSRKRMLDEKADVLVALPGGFGTLEEVLEVITSKQLGYHKKPIIIFNFEGYYDPLLEQFNRSFEQNFAKEIFSSLYYVTYDINDMFNYIDNYDPSEVEDKWS